MPEMIRTTSLMLFHKMVYYSTDSPTNSFIWTSVFDLFQCQSGYFAVRVKKPDHFVQLAV